ncbi:hypothetical protein [Agromyces sp. NPDC058104]|uniref:hypothetical protein n=1 Tax=Agromyces sp. NPDC058104 TaxID=3346342 RepID=UPI0036DBA6DC
MTTILGIDPGGRPSAAKSRSATGWSAWEYDAVTPPRPITHGQVQGDEWRFRRWFLEEMPEAFPGGRPDEIVCERFLPDGRTLFPDITPLKIEGILIMARPDTVFQPNGFKSALVDKKIHELGLWWPGEGHAIDSMRHVFALLKERRHMPTLMLWPPRRAS